MSEKKLFDKNDSFALRGWCILLIIVHHIVLFYTEKYGMEFSRWAIELRNLGYAVVGAFFVLSGYGVYQSVMRNRPLSARYWVRRLKKLILPFVFALIVVSLIVLFMEGITLGDFLLCLVTLTLPTEVLWFMKAILIYHVLTYVVLGNVRNPRVALAIISVAAVAWVVVSHYCLNMWNFWWMSLLCFPLGLWLSAYSDKLAKLDRPITWCGIAALFLAMEAVVVWTNSHYCSESMKFAILPWVNNLVAASFALLFIKFVPMLGTKSKTLNYLGRNSLILYIGHVGLLNLFSPQSPVVYTLLVVFVAVAITVVYDWLDRKVLSKNEVA